MSGPTRENTGLAGVFGALSGISGQATKPLEQSSGVTAPVETSGSVSENTVQAGQRPPQAGEQPPVSQREQTPPTSRVVEPASTHESRKTATCPVPEMPKVQSGRKVKFSTNPFSLRLTPEERAYLEEKAGARPLGAYIRTRLLDGRAEKRRPQRKPKIDDKQIALVLAELGRSRLSSNLNQLAKASNCGTLDVSSEVERDLQAACHAVVTMRDNLIAALGLGAGG